MAQKFDRLFDRYEQIVPPWFWDVAAAAMLLGVVSWVLSLVI